MTSGLPVIASINAGVSEVIKDGLNGLLLREPTNAVELARLIRRLVDDPSLMEQLAENAVTTARQCTLDDNAAARWELLNNVSARKRSLVVTRERT